MWPSADGRLSEEPYPSWPWSGMRPPGASGLPPSNSWSGQGPAGPRLPTPGPETTQTRGGAGLTRTEQRTSSWPAGYDWRLQNYGHSQRQSAPGQWRLGASLPTPPAGVTPRSELGRSGGVSLPTPPAGLTPQAVLNTSIRPGAHENTDAVRARLGNEEHLEIVSTSAQSISRYPDHDSGATRGLLGRSGSEVDLMTQSRSKMSYPWAEKFIDLPQLTRDTNCSQFGPSPFGNTSAPTAGANPACFPGLRLGASAEFYSMTTSQSRARCEPVYGSAACEPFAGAYSSAGGWGHRASSGTGVYGGGGVQSQQRNGYAWDQFAGITAASPVRHDAVFSGRQQWASYEQPYAQFPGDVSRAVWRDPSQLQPASWYNGASEGSWSSSSSALAQTQVTWARASAAWNGDPAGRPAVAPASVQHLEPVRATEQRWPRTYPAASPALPYASTGMLPVSHSGPVPYRERESSQTADQRRPNGAITGPIETAGIGLDAGSTGMMTYLEPKEEPLRTNGGGIVPKEGYEPEAGQQQPAGDCATKETELGQESDTVAADSDVWGGPPACPPPKKEELACDCGVNKVRMTGAEDVGPVYSRLGAATSLEALRTEMAQRIGLDVCQVRLETVRYTGREGKTELGCPIAKWVLRRRDSTEQLLVVAKRRPGHQCGAAYTVVLLVLWDALPQRRADDLYESVLKPLNESGTPTRRGCGTNRHRTCMCQGLDTRTEGASFSFGCAYSMYYNACKFARSQNPRKFRLSHPEQERVLENELQRLAAQLAPIYRRVAPVAYQNQVRSEESALECRLGLEPGRPWSGVTACLDFCAHAHRDVHNVLDGCTMVLTLLKPGGGESGRPPSRQTTSAAPGHPDSTGAPGEPTSNVSVGLNGPSSGDQSNTSHSQELRSSSDQTAFSHSLPSSNHQPVSQNRRPDLPNGHLHQNVQQDPSHGELGALGPSFSVLGHNDPSMHVLPLQDNPRIPLHENRNGTPQPEFAAVPEPASERAAGDIQPQEGPDEQLHVLPMYVLEEDGDPGGQQDTRPGVERLRRFPVEIRRREVPLAACSRKRKLAGDAPASRDYPWMLPDKTHKDRAHKPAPATGGGLTHGGPGIMPGIEPRVAAAGVFDSVRPASASDARSPQRGGLCATLVNIAGNVRGAPGSVVPGTARSPVANTLATDGRRAQTRDEPMSLFSTRPADTPKLGHSYHNLGPSYPSGAPATHTFDHSIPTIHIPDHQDTMSFRPDPYDFDPGDAGEHSLAHMAKGVGSNGWTPRSRPPGPWPVIEPLPREASESVPGASESVPQGKSEPVPSDACPPAAEPSDWEREAAATGAGVDRTADGVRLYRYWSDSAASFEDSKTGGVAIALTHGSLLFECAVDELHATTALRRPDRRRPSRLALVFYQHKGLHRRRHGWMEKAERERQREARLQQQEARRQRQAKEKTPAAGAGTTQTWSMAPPAPVPCLVTGPYAPWQLGYAAAMAPHWPQQELFIV